MMLNPLNTSFLIKTFDAFYKQEYQLGNVFLFFSIVAIIIGCMGLFGLVSFSVEQRVKEIGIRKVLGANPLGLTMLLSRNYTLKVLGGRFAGLAIGLFHYDKLAGKFSLPSGNYPWHSLSVWNSRSIHSLVDSQPENH